MFNPIWMFSFNSLPLGECAKHRGLKGNPLIMLTHSCLDQLILCCCILNYLSKLSTDTKILHTKAPFRLEGLIEKCS